MRFETRAVHAGGGPDETTGAIAHRASSAGPGSTAPENLLRPSIGLEHPDDLVADLRRALAGAG